MAALGPFEPAPRIAAGVSGGADSMALAILALTWTRERGGSLLVLVVDHRLRSESGREAAQTVARLDARGIEAKILEIHGLEHGPSLAERARMARFAALEAACAEAGILHLLLGHHSGDQAETLQIRALGGSGPGGMAGMAPVVETRMLRLLRPLLAIPPVRLRATLRSFGVAWVEDPSNNDASALRPRLRLLRRDNAGAGSATAALVAASVASGRLRNEQEGQHRCPSGRRCRDAARGLRSAIGAAAPAAGSRGIVADDCRGAVSAGYPVGLRPRVGAQTGDACGGPAVVRGPAGDGIACGSRRCRHGAAGIRAARRRLGRAVSPQCRGPAAGRGDFGPAGRRRHAAPTVLPVALRSAADPPCRQDRPGTSRRAASALS